MSIVAIAGTAFTYYLPGLEDQANPGLFKSSPTITAADFTMSTNGGAFAALTNTPTVSPAGSTQLAIALSAAETTAAGAGGRITVNCQDAAGAEWYSVGITIPVQADDVSTLGGTAQTGDAYARITTTVEPAIADVPTVAEMNARTLVAAAYFDPATDTVTPAGGQINSVSSTISANVVQIEGETVPVDNLVLALGTGGLVEKLNSMLEAAGLAYRFTAAALAEAPTEAGSGTGTYTDTIKDPSNNPLDGARVQLSTDAAGTHRVYEAFTNALGVFTMNPDPGTYYRWIDLAGYTDRLTQGAQVTVT